MAQAIGDPEEIRSFSNTLEHYLNTVEEETGRLNSAFEQLGESWQDQQTPHSFQDQSRHLPMYLSHSLPIRGFRTLPASVPHTIQKLIFPYFFHQRKTIKQKGGNMFVPYSRLSSQISFSLNFCFFFNVFTP